MSVEPVVEAARSLVPLIEEERPHGDQRARLGKRVVEAC